jgi:sugar lactone lactonase YvrE
MPRLTVLVTIIAVSVLVLSVHLVLANGLASVADFDVSDGELPEGLAVDKQGNFYVGIAPTGEIKQVTPEGQVTTFANLPPPGSGFMTGIAADRQGNLYVALASFNPDTHGIWKVSNDGSNVDLFVSLPEGGLPNLPAFDRQGNLFVSDSFLGRIWKIDHKGNATVWKEDPLLEAAPGGPLNLPVGVNGIAFDHNQRHLYAANTLGGRIVRILLNPDGTAGEVEVIVEDHALLEGADGIAFDNRENLYVAVNSQNRLVKMSPDGNVGVVTEGGPLQFPASLAFGAGRESKNLYITNFAILNAQGIAPGDPKPALLVLSVGTPGQPLP